MTDNEYQKEIDLLNLKIKYLELELELAQIRKNDPTYVPYYPPFYPDPYIPIPPNFPNPLDPYIRWTCGENHLSDKTKE